MPSNSDYKDKKRSTPSPHEEALELMSELSDTIGSHILDKNKPIKIERRRASSGGNSPLSKSLVNIPNGLDIEKGLQSVNGQTKCHKEMPCVKVTGAVKCYGSSRILKGLDMNVEQGTIYSLLGSSGCGKTTLLTCIVGIKHLDSGQVLVFGAKTGTRESGIPGNRVGYMPQVGLAFSKEIALYGDLTIKETIQYFGAINGMSRKEVIGEMIQLIDLLDLPDPSRLVSQLSGGQQRRVSLAVSLLHSPELIILDEPTVGVDPLLRESIWNHIRELVRVNQVTVIITTHYIDEARHSSRIGVMRDGKILAEKSPQALYDEYNTTFLEDIVLKLCHEDEKSGKQKRLITIKPKSKKGIRTSGKEDEISFMPLEHNNNGSFSKQRFHCWDPLGSFQRIRAMLTKNVLLTLRRILFTVFLLLVPGTILPIVCSVAGGEIKGLKVGVVNNDMNSSAECEAFLRQKSACEMEGFSCRFLHQIPDDIIKLVEFGNLDGAEAALANNDLNAVISFKEKFSESVFFKMSGDTSASSKLLLDSQISVKLDETSPVIGPTIQGVLSKSYNKFVHKLLADCELPAELGMLPFKTLDPIYGGEKDHVRNYGAIAFLVAFSYFFTMCSTSLNFVFEKKQRTMERAQICGVHIWEILTASLITELILLLIQIGFSFAIFFLAFDAEIVGSHVTAFMLLLMMGLVGNAAGFIWGVFSREEVEAILLCIFSFFPGIFLGGLFYPVEAIPKPLLTITHYSLPTFFAGEALRSVFHRGYGISHKNVWHGFATTGAWIVVFWILTIVVHRIRGSRM